MSALIQAEQFACTLKIIENEIQMNERFFQVICEKCNIETLIMVSSDAQPDSVYTSNNKRIYVETLKKMKVI